MTKEKDKDLVPFNEHNLVPDPETRKEIMKSLEGVSLVFPVIKILHQAIMFEMPDGSKAESFRGIILDTNLGNAWWETPFEESGGGDIPDCFSRNGIHPGKDVLEPQAPTCTACEKNQFGTDGHGKACKNMRRVHVIVEGTFLPYRLSLSPANLKPADKYLILLASKGLGYIHVLTEFKLKEATNQDNIKYSEIVLSNLQKIETNTVIDQLKRMREEFLDSMREQVITYKEYDPNIEKKEAPDAQ